MRPRGDGTCGEGRAAGERRGEARAGRRREAGDAADSAPPANVGLDLCGVHAKLGSLPTPGLGTASGTRAEAGSGRPGRSATSWTSPPAPFPGKFHWRACPGTQGEDPAVCDSWRDSQSKGQSGEGLVSEAKAQGQVATLSREFSLMKLLTAKYWILIPTVLTCPCPSLCHLYACLYVSL
jgi:hypothetical protein